MWRWEDHSADRCPWFGKEHRRRPQYRSRLFAEWRGDERVIKKKEITLTSSQAGQNAGEERGRDDPLISPACQLFKYGPLTASGHEEGKNWVMIVPAFVCAWQSKLRANAMNNAGTYAITEHVEEGNIWSRSLWGGRSSSARESGRKKSVLAKLRYWGLYSKQVCEIDLSQPSSADHQMRTMFDTRTTSIE